MSEETMGERIRRLRIERRLSLAQVAGEEFSRAFLNQVESGRSQPSTRVLRVIATRLGAPLDYLVEGPEAGLERELALELARLALARGEPARALALAEPLPGPEALACRAVALLALGREADARGLLQAAGLDAGRHEARGERARREGRTADAVRHFRAARVLREGARYWGRSEGQV